MRKALMSAAIAVCGTAGGLFAGDAQATKVGFSVNVQVPFVVAQPVFVAQPVYVARPVIVAPAAAVVVQVGGFRHGHRHFHHHNHRHHNRHHHRRGGYRY